MKAWPGNLGSVKIDRRLRRAAWAAIAIALVVFALLATGCSQYRNICWVECPTGLPCHESCVVVPR